MASFQFVLSVPAISNNHITTYPKDLNDHKKHNFNTIINTKENKTEKVNTICSLRNNQKKLHSLPKLN